VQRRLDILYGQTVVWLKVHHQEVHKEFLFWREHLFRYDCKLSQVHSMGSHNFSKSFLMPSCCVLNFVLALDDTHFMVANPSAGNEHEALKLFLG